MKPSTLCLVCAIIAAFGIPVNDIFIMGLYIMLAASNICKVIEISSIGWMKK